MRPRDVTQLKAAAIAIKEEWRCKIKHGFVLTASRRYEEVDLNKSNDALAEEIKQYLSLAKSIKAGNPPQPEPSKRKCSGCQYRPKCEYAL